MNLKIKWEWLILVGMASTIVLLSTTSVCQAQPETPKQRLRSPATVREGIGGEAKNYYVIRAKKGQRMTITFSWHKEGDNTADFGVEPDSETAEPLDGKSSQDGKRWTGTIPRTGDYLISVWAHPSARYKLSVVLR